MKAMYSLIAVLAFTGCSMRSHSDIGHSPQTPAVRPSGILVEVNGAYLTREQADRELDAEITQFNDMLQSKSIKSVRERLLDNIVEQFIRRALLLQEAERQNIRVTEEDRAETFKELEAGLSNGQTLAETIKDSPMGEQETMRQIIASIRIKKLLTRGIPRAIEVSEEEIAGFYEDNKGQLDLPEHVAARHILIPLHAGDTEQDREEQRIKAEQIRQQIIDGADFAELAEQYSSCPSGAQGGNLGVFRKGQMIKEFDEAAFSREVGVIGPLVKTTFGYHIIQVQEHNEAELLPREKVVELLRDEKRKHAVNEFIKVLRRKADITDYRNLIE
jgi:peptidyl-prolyl cis-trans isomerase C